MRRGSKGAVGAGIYFCASLSGFQRKARSNGWTIKAKVHLVRAKVVNYTPGTDLPNFTFCQLQCAHYDSVELHGFNSGTEYVVYSKEQVEILAVYKD